MKQVRISMKLLQEIMIDDSAAEESARDFLKRVERKIKSLSKQSPSKVKEN